MPWWITVGGYKGVIMDYQEEMRKHIDMVKKMSMTAPLDQTLEDMKMLSSAVKDLSDRIEMRVRKSLVPDDSKAKKVSSKTKSSSKTPKPFPSIKPRQNLPTNNQSTLPTSNPVSSSSVSAMDISNSQSDFIAKQKALQPVSPVPPQ